MIVIRMIPVTTNPQDTKEFQASLKNNCGNESGYCLIRHGNGIPWSARIVIDLPDNCIVLSNPWDKYISYALDNGLPKGDPKQPNTWVTWKEYVIKKLGLVDRRHNGIFAEVKVIIPSKLTKIMSYVWKK